MNNEQLYIFGMMQAEVARVEAMKAENQHRLACGNSIAYGEEAFSGSASALEQLAPKALNS